MKEDMRTVRSCKAIESAYIQLLKERPYTSITVENILDLAGYSKTAFYNNYSNKADVSASIGMRLSRHLTNAIGAAISQSGLKVPSYQEGEQVLINIYRAVYEYKDIYSIFYDRFGVRSLDYIFETCLSNQRTNKACNSGSVDPRINTELYRHAHIWGTLGSVIYWIENDFKESPEYMGHQHYLRFVAIRRPES